MTQGWRTAAAALGLLFLVGCVVLVGVLTVRGSQEDAGRIVQFLGIVLAVPALAIPIVVWWRRGVVTAPRAGQLDEARETLAGVIAQQWRQEALARSLGDPEPMPVCWGLTEPAVMDHPGLIALGELSFTGRSDQIGFLAAQFRRLRRRRLVILGGPGSGKTTLAVQLLLELLITRQPGEPIPVLVSLAGWDPTEQPRLHTWLAARLAEDYPALRAFGPTMAQALAEQGHLLPILDGLDELPEPRQPEVITALNKSLADTDHLVLTSRTSEYRTAITQAGNVLTSAAAIAPQPLTPAQAAEYLTHCLPPDPGPTWHDLLHRLRTNTAGPLASVLATPLGLWLLRTVYLTPQADPTPLLDSAPALDATTLRARLFDQLIPAVLATRPPSRHPSDTFRPRHTWNPDHVRNWLTYLAHHLHHANTQNLHWWGLAQATLSPPAVRLASGLAGGLAGGLADGLIFGLTNGLPDGLLFGLVGALAGWLVGGLAVRHQLIDEPAYASLKSKHRVTPLARKPAIGLAFGLAGALMVGLEGGLKLKHGLAFGLLAGLGGGLMFALMFGLTSWLASRLLGRHWLTDEPAHASLKSKHRDTPLARNLTFGLAFGLGCALAVGLIIALAAGLRVGLAIGLSAGLAEGLRVGLAFGLASWLAFGLAGWLALGVADRHWLTEEPAYANLKVTHRVTLLARKLTFGLAIGLALGLVIWLMAGLALGLGFGLSLGLTKGLTSGLVFGLTVGLAFGLADWVGTPSRTDWASTPQSTYTATRSLTALQFSLAGLAGGLVSSLAFGPVGAVLVGLAGGLTVGLALVSSGAWLSYLLAICRLAASGKLPLRLMDFLDDAYRLGLLRSVGPVYQFRHAGFQDHLVRKVNDTSRR